MTIPTGVEENLMSNDEFLKIVNRSVDLRVRGGEGDLVISARLAAKAAHDRPEEPSAWHTLAMVSADLGAHAEALYCRRRAVELLDALAVYKKVPDDQCQYVQQCVFGYATSILLHGSWEKAWPYWEIGRLGYSWVPPEGTKYWQGETDGNLLIVCEGGYGDLFLFSRFLPALRAQRRPAGRIGLFVWPGLGAFRDWWALGVNDVYEIDQPVPSGVWKYSTSIMSLPAMLGVKSPAEVPPDRMLVGTRDSTSGIGFCWRSEENQTKRRFRSLPAEDAEAIALCLRADIGTEIFSLCPGSGSMRAPARLRHRQGSWTSAVWSPGERPRGSSRRCPWSLRSIRR
jgi:hypothetical protein